LGSQKNRGPIGPRPSYQSKRHNYSAASATGFLPLNWAVSVDAPMAVVEAAPLVTATGPEHHDLRQADRRFHSKHREVCL